MKKIFILLMVFMAACSSVPSVVPPMGGGFLMADVERSTAPALSDPLVSELVNGNNAFAFDLYQKVIENSNGNLIFSPYSISLAFSMLYAGARSDTETQLADVLHYLPQDAQHSAFNALDQYFDTLGRDEASVENQEEFGDPFQLSIANAVWGQNGYPFQDDFLEILAAEYGAGLRLADFINDYKTAVDEINGWIADETNDRIKDMVPPEGVITPDTRMVLANAIYFKAAWLNKFEELATEEAPFTLLDGSQVNVDMMRNDSLRVRYLEDDGFQAAILPYAGGKTGMLVILPEEGRYEEIESNLTADMLSSILEGAAPEKIVFAMPKIDFETDLDLAELLKQMGLELPFIPDVADFSGIDGTKDLFVSSALHRANITVDEEGTEAAAATIIAVGTTALEIGEPTEMIVDSPYIFAIFEEETGSVLFLGRTLNPAQ